MQQEDKIKIIQKAKERNADAFTQLIKFYSKDMYRVALAILMNDEDVADAMQETILSCWEKIHTLKKEEFFKTWLTRILINKCYDIRNEKKRFDDMENMTEPSEEDHYNIEFKEALSTLDEKYRIIMTLFYAEGYRINEIADMLKIPPSTVQTRLQRGRDKLAGYYQDIVGV